MKRIVGAIAAVTLIGGLFVAPTASAAAPDGQVTASYIVPTKHGKLYLEIVHPTKGGKILRAPLILTYSPYSVLGRNGDAAEFVPDGYARGYADLVGTGNSGGCWDYGGIREKESAYQLVEWIAKQKWSTGKIAMYGGSYNGTTANAAAVMRPPHLTTIVPEAAISRWYGYAYSGGIRYSYTNEWMSHQGRSAVDDEGFDTPLAFDFGLAIPPPVDPQNPDWAERVQDAITPCDEIEHTEHGYDDTPDYDKFWLERDYVKDAAKVTIPVLVASNWGDWNVKQEESWNFFQALKNSEKRVLYMGTRWDDHGAPASEAYKKTVHKWFDHYLMGKDNGVEDMPSVVSQTSDSEGPGKYLSGAPKTTNVHLIIQQVPRTSPDIYAWQMLPQKPRVYPTFGGGADNTAAFPSTNINTESHASHHARQNHDWHWFETPAFGRDVRVFGQIKLQLYSKIQREWVTITPSLFDFDPGDHEMVAGQHVNTDPKALVAVTRGFLDSRYRDGLSKQVPIKPGQLFESTTALKPTDYTFKAGHYIGLNIQTEILEWMVPKPYPNCDGSLPNPQDLDQDSCATFTIDWENARTRLVVPVVNAPKNPAKLFDAGHHH